MRVHVEVPARSPAQTADRGRAGRAIEELEASPGRPLPDELRREMEARFGCDLTQVRIHQDARADDSARAIHARAFTFGQDIYFAAGAFEPAKIDGRRLLAHEIAHSIQQRSVEPPARPSPPRPLLPGGSCDAAEAQARAASGAALSGGRLPPGVLPGVGLAPAAGPRIARWADSIPDDRAADSSANPFVETLALDVARALQRDPADAGAHTQRRLGRLDSGTRAAVVARTQQLLTPAERERSAQALTGAAVAESEERPGGRTAPPAPAQAGPEHGDQHPRPDQPRQPDQLPRLAEPAEGGTAPAVDRDREVDHAEPAAREVGASTREGPVAGARHKDAETKTHHGEPGAVPGHAAPRTDRGGGRRRRGDTQQRPSTGTPVGDEPRSAEGTGEQVPAAGGAPEHTRPGPALDPVARPGAGSPSMVGAGQSHGADAGGQPDLGPVDTLDAIAESRLRERLARAQTAGDHGIAPTPVEEQPPARAAAGPDAHSEGPAAPGAAQAQLSDAATAPEESVAQEPATTTEPAQAPADDRAAGAAELTTPTSAAADDEPAAPSPASTRDASPVTEADAPPATEADSSPVTEADASPVTEAASVQDERPRPDAGGAGRSIDGLVDRTPAVAAAPPAILAATEPDPISIPAAESTTTEPAVASPAADELAESHIQPAETPATDIQPPAETPATDQADVPPTDQPTADLSESDASQAGGDGATDTTSETDSSDAGPAGAAGGGAGGDCGADSPPGTGGGSPPPAIEDRPTEPEPDLTQAEPEEAMAIASNLAPGPLVRAMDGVDSAAARVVASERADLAANPPSVERPSGSPRGRDAGSVAPGQTPATTKASPATRAHRVPGKGTAPGRRPPPLPIAPPSPILAIKPPAMAGAAQTPVTPQEAQALAGSIDELPTTDPGLAITAGPPPTLDLAGGADPRQVGDQRAQVDQTIDTAAREAQIDARAPLGEGNIYPLVPPETLQADGSPQARAAVAAPAAAAPGQAAAGQAAPGQPAPGRAAAGPDPAEIIARERSGEEVRAAAAAAQNRMAASRQEHDAKVEQAGSDSDAAIDAEVRANADSQDEVRARTLPRVVDQRRRWSADQRTALDKHGSAADEQVRRLDAEVAAPQAEAERAANAEIDKGNQQAAVERRRGEANARRERERAEEESSGVLGWLADKARAFFDEVCSLVKRAFDAARQLVHDAIDAAVKAAGAIIDRARDAITAAIRDIGDALQRLGDELLAAFPALHERYRRAIQGLVDDAVKAVDHLADALRETVRRALNVLAAALDAVCSFLEEALLAAIDAARKAALGAIQAARAALSMLASWLPLIADVAANPMQWLRNLGAAAVDGLKNHLWRAFKCAIKEWFNSKVEEVVGLPTTIWKWLRRGGIKFAEIGRMVWEGLKAAIPGILIELAIAKIAAVIVPALGMIMQIIDGLRAAWGTIKRILAAFEKFFAFLRAVKSGNGGPKFAEMIAAAAIVVLDFLANFLVQRLMKPAKPIAGRLAELGRKIMAKLGGALRAVGRGLKKAGQAVKRGAQKVIAVARKAAGAVKTVAVRGAHGVARLARSGARAVTRLGGRALGALQRRLPGVARAVKGAGRMLKGAGRKIQRGWRQAKGWVEAKRAQYKNWRERRRMRRGTPQERLDRAVSALAEPLQRMFRSGVGRAALRFRLWRWRMRYGLSQLRLETSGERGVVRATVNPSKDVKTVFVPSPAHIRALVSQVMREIRRDPQVATAARRIRAAQLRGLRGENGEGTVELTQAADYLALGHLHRARRLALADAFAKARHALGQRLGIAGEALKREFNRIVRHHAETTPKAPTGSSSSGIKGVFKKTGEVNPGWLNFIYGVGGKRVADHQQRADRAEQSLVGFHGAADYPGIAARLAGSEDARLADDLRQLVQHGKPASGPNAPLLSALAYLMFGRETMRRPDSAAYAAMTIQLIERDKMTFKTAFDSEVVDKKDDEAAAGEGRGGGGGAFPASRAKKKIAVTPDDLAAADPASELGKRRREDLAKSIATEHETQRRELALAELWLGVEAKADGEAFSTPQDVENYVRRKLRTFFLKHGTAT